MYLALLAALTFPAAGCQPDPPAQSSADSVPAGLPDKPGMNAADADSMSFEIVVPPEVRAGEKVPLALRVENTSKKPLEIHLLGRTITFDIIVARADGPVVWRRLEGKVGPAILQIKILAPGEVLELKDTWDQRTNSGTPVAPGRYTVMGSLPSDAPDPLETSTVPLNIVPR